MDKVKEIMGMVEAHGHAVVALYIAKAPSDIAKELKTVDGIRGNIEAALRKLVEREPLSDEQIAEACGWKAELGCKPLPRELRIARAIEISHGI